MDGRHKLLARRGVRLARPDLNMRPRAINTSSVYPHDVVVIDVSPLTNRQVQRTRSSSTASSRLLRGSAGSCCACGDVFSSLPHPPRRSYCVEGGSDIVKLLVKEVGVGMRGHGDQA